MRETLTDKKAFRKVLDDLLVRTRLVTTAGDIQHGTTSVLEHSIAVALYAQELADHLHLKIRREELIRGALLHDYFLYDWHNGAAAPSWHGFKHPGIALRNALRHCSLTRVEQDIIRKHMFPLTPIPPMHRESFLVCIADKICSSFETVKRTDKLHVYREAAMELKLSLRRIRGGGTQAPLPAERSISDGTDGIAEDKKNLSTF